MLSGKNDKFIFNPKKTNTEKYDMIQKALFCFFLFKTNNKDKKVVFLE